MSHASTLLCWACTIAVALPGLAVTQQRVDKLIKKDQTVVEGIVLKVTDSAIEMDPVGRIPFVIILRESVDMIIYSDNTVVKFSYEATSAAANPAAAGQPLVVEHWSDVEFRNEQLVSFGWGYGNKGDWEESRIVNKDGRSIHFVVKAKWTAERNVVFLGGYTWTYEDVDVSVEVYDEDTLCAVKNWLGKWEMKPGLSDYGIYGGKSGRTEPKIVPGSKMVKFMKLPLDKFSFDQGKDYKTSIGAFDYKGGTFRLHLIASGEWLTIYLDLNAI